MCAANKHVDEAAKTLGSDLTAQQKAYFQGVVSHWYIFTRFSEPRRSQRKRNQTDFLGGTEAPRKSVTEAKREARRAHEAAIASAYDRLVGLVQLGEAGGAGGRVWVGTDGSAALPRFAPPSDERQQFLDPVQTTIRCAGVPRAGGGRASPRRYRPPHTAPHLPSAV